MPSLEARLTVLEQVRSRASVMRVLHPGCHQHHGLFIVKAGTRTYKEERKPLEVWDDFARRMDVHANGGVLRLLQFLPVNTEGTQMYMNEPLPEEYENG